jgi:sodium/potassium-transporting ATPase subunit alpha
MEKPILVTDEKEMEATELERGVGRSRTLQYASDVNDRRVSVARSRSRSRRGSMDSIRQVRSVDPSLVLPPQYRTMSFNIEEGRRRSLADEARKQKLAKEGKKEKASAKAGDNKIEFNDITYHKTPVDELLSQFSSSRANGLSQAYAAQQLKTVGPNLPTPPPSQWFRKTVSTHTSGLSRG